MKQSVPFFGVLISLLILASLVNAATLPVTVTPENMVLRDANGNIIATSLTVALINNTGGYVQLARALTESGTIFPTVPAVGYLYYRTDLQALYIWTGLQWATAMSATLPPGTISYNDLADKPDLTVYLFMNGSRPLDADWNTGAYGIYGLTFLNATSITVTNLNATNVYANTVYLGNLLTDPVAPAKGQMWYNSAQDTMKYYNGTAVVIVPGIGGGSSSSYTLPYSYTVYKTGSTYYMEKYDGTTYSTTNASKLFVYLIGNLTTGSAFLRNAIYDVSSMTSYFNVAGKGITLIGESWDDTIILDSRTGTTATFNTVASSTPTANFTVRNIKFDRSVPNDATAKYCIGGSFYKIDVEHCQFLGNKALAEGASHYLTGAVLGDWASDYFVNCYFKNNRVVDFQYGLASTNSAYTDASGNYIENAWTQALAIQVPIANGNYIIQNNFLNNCALFDEGIAIDSVNPAVAVNTNTLISNNILFNDASHDPVKPISSITTSGVRISNNKIVTLSSTDADWWGQIATDARDTTELTNITIENNDIWTMQRRGIEIRGLSSGSVSGNVIHSLYAGEAYGIKFSYTKAITYAGTTVNVEDNKIYMNKGSTTRHAIYLTATAGTGQITFFIDGNYFESGMGIETNYDSLLSTVLGRGNIFNCTTTVLDSGASTAYYMENWGSSTTAVNGTVITHSLWATPTFVSISSRNVTEAIICHAVAYTATTFTLIIYDDANAAVTGQSIVWYARSDP